MFDRRTSRIQPGRAGTGRRHVGTGRRHVGTGRRHVGTGRRHADAGQKRRSPVASSYGLAGLRVALGAALVALGCSESAQPEHRLDRLEALLQTNADIAYAVYSDSVLTAEELAAAIDELVRVPSASTHAAAKVAWRRAREPYGQSEVFRFRSSPIDDTNYNPDDGEDGPEGRINAWPLGEALIDYVVEGTDFGLDEVGVTGHTTGVPASIPPNNIINTPSVSIDTALLQKTAGADDERDVLAGYHLIEFLLWGQDLNADGSADTVNSREQGNDTGGHRPFTDFAKGVQCTSGTASADASLCQRRGAYLQAAAAQLVADLTQVRNAWAPGAPYRKAFAEVKTVEAGKAKVLEILTGMGTLSEGELAGERMQIALSANSQEDEHSCFSDNTHRDIWLNAEGVANVFLGEYAGYDRTLDGQDDATGNKVSGYGIDDYLTDMGLDALRTEVETALATTRTHYQAIDAAARAGKPVDVLIVDAQGVDAKPMRDCIQALNAQSVKIIEIARDLDLGNAAVVVDPAASACDTTDPTSPC